MQWSFKIIQSGQLPVVLLHTVIQFNIIIIFLQWFLETVEGPNDQINTALFLVTSQRWSSANALITALMYLFTAQTQIISVEYVKKVNTRHKFLSVLKCDEFGLWWHNPNSDNIWTYEINKKVYQNVLKFMYFLPKPSCLSISTKAFDLPRNLNYRGKFQWNFDQGKGNLVRVGREFESSEFELSRFNCRLIFCLLLLQYKKGSTKFNIINYNRCLLVVLK